jgi:IMP dehydrogenase
VNKVFEENISFSYDDLLLRPQLSDIKSRGEVSLKSRLGNFTKNIEMRLPIIASPMTTICEHEMQNAFADYGSFGIIHRYCSIEKQVEMISKCKGDMISFAIGATGDYMERAIAGVKAGANIICIDVANGFNTSIKKSIKNIKVEFGSDVFIIGGNVADAEGFNFLADLGLSGIRVGVGTGSICSTRIQTGHGIGVAASLWDIARNKGGYSCSIIADGGIRYSGDIVKALALGAHSVIVGSFIAGTEETPGVKDYDEDLGKHVKIYEGMASKEAQEDWLGYSKSIEGVSTKVLARGGVRDVLEATQLEIKSGLSYSGARTISELRRKAQFMRQTQVSREESSPHIYNKRF